jgi:hypothetical protein
MMSGKTVSKKTLADKADKFVCYQKSVQTPDHEVEFFDRAFRDCYRRKALTLREDFCGTFAICCKWVKSNKDRSALGVDLCKETIQWGRDHNLSKLSDEQQSRVRLLTQDVRKRNRPSVDIVSAQNFSFWIFKTRQEVIEYFKIVRSNLNAEGIFVMDMMGGSECFLDEHTDKRVIKKGKNGFRYDWEQVSFDPITHDVTFRIHFKFADGSWIKSAFEYQWRFWTLPEVREMLAEAGFSQSFVYWENEDKNGEGDGTYDRSEVGTADPSWICYIVAQK